MKPIEIKRNKSAFIKLIISFFLAFIISAKYAYSNFMAEESWKNNLAIFLAIFCALMFAFLVNSIIQITKKSHALIISREGIFDHVSMAKAGLIPWKNIQKFDILKNGGSEHLFLFVKDPDIYLNKVKGIKKKMLNQLLIDKGSPISINLSLIKISKQELIKILSKKIR